MKPISQKKPTHTKRDPQVPLNVCFLESQRTCQSDASTLQGSFRSSARSCPCCRSCRWFVRDTTVVHVGNTVRTTSLCTTLYFLGNQKKKWRNICCIFFACSSAGVYAPCATLYVLGGQVEENKNESCCCYRVVQNAATIFTTKVMMFKGE